MLMKTHPKISTFIVTLICLLALAGCNVLNERAQQREARAGLEIIVGTMLPESDQFDLVETVSFDDSGSESGMVTCYYAVDYLIIGAPVPETEALNSYAADLHLLGWEPRSRQYPTSRVFRYGDNARAVATIGNPGASIRDAVDYAQVRTLYQSIIFVRLDFILPSREAC